MFVWSITDCLLGAFPAGTVYTDQCPYPSPQWYQNSLAYTLANPGSSGQTYQPYNRVWVEITATHLTTYPTQLQGFLQLMHSYGIAVELLGDNQTWASSLTAAADAVSLCNAVAAFNAAAPSTAHMLDGVQFDLEPHVLPGWTSNTGAGKDPYNDLYENAMLAIFRGCSAVFDNQATTLSWTAATFYPRWASDMWTPILQERLLDYVTFMNYYVSESVFTNGWGGTGGVSLLLAACNNTLPAVFAAELSNPATTPTALTSETWWYNGTLPLENMLGNVADAYATAPGFMGLAVNEWVSYVYAQPTGPGLVPTCVSSGTSITVYPNGASVGSVGIYSSAWAFRGAMNVTGAGPHMVTATRSAAKYNVQLFDGPGLTYAGYDSVLYSITC